MLPCNFVLPFDKGMDGEVYPFLMVQPLHVVMLPRCNLILCACVGLRRTKEATKFDLPVYITQSHVHFCLLFIFCFSSSCTPIATRDSGIPLVLTRHNFVSSRRLAKLRAQGVRFVPHSCRGFGAMSHVGCVVCICPEYALVHRLVILPQAVVRDAVCLLF